MNGKVVCFEKYSVAPSPSRDYYGIKVFQDEVVLFVWKVSHGPHVAPAVHVTKFFEFPEDKALQDQITNVFGKPLLLHIKSITSGKCKTLLALPINLIIKISAYLSIPDIVKLSSLSHIANQIFNDNGLWKILYKRCLSNNIFQYKNDCAVVQGWRNLMKDNQMGCKIKRETADSVKSAVKQFRKPTETIAKSNRAALQNLKPMKTMCISKVFDYSQSKECDTKKHSSHNRTNKASSSYKTGGFHTLRETNSTDSVQITLPFAKLHPILHINTSLQDLKSKSIPEEKRLSARCTVRKHINSNSAKLHVSNETTTERCKSTLNADPKATCNIKSDKANRKSKQVHNTCNSGNTINKTGSTKKLHVKVPVSSTKVLLQK